MCLFPIQLSSSYYVYQVAKKLKGAEELLQAMGYEKIGGSREAQELKYTGDVDSNKIAETAADLVILDGELDRIKSLVVYANNEHIPIILSIILEVRSYPTSIYTDAKFTLDQYHPQGHLPVQPFEHRLAAQGQSPPPRAQGSQQQHYATPPPQRLTPLQWQQSQSRSMQPHGQPSYPDTRRSSAPNVDQRKKANQVRIDNHPKNLQLSEDLYANFPVKKDSINDYVNYTPRTPFSPPDPNDFPEPIVQSQSELARLNLFGGDDGPCSMVDARSEQVGYSNDPYLNSLESTMGSPEYNAEFNKQAEDAWQIGTPTQKRTISKEEIVDPEINEEEQIVDVKDDNLVTQEWLNETVSTEDRSYDNQSNFQPKEDFKKYDKPIPEVKQKTEVPETLGRQQNNEPSPNLPNLDTPEPDTTRVQANHWQHNTCDYQNRPAGYKPIAKPRSKLDVEKSSTGSHLPTPSIETPYKPHTSPLSSLEQQSFSSNDSEDFRSAPSQQPTTLDNTTDDHLNLKQEDFVLVSSPESSTTTGSQEGDRTGEFEHVSYDSSTQELFSTTINLDSSEQPPSRPLGSLSPQPPSGPPDSLPPITRSRSAAVSKGSPTTSSSSIVATPHSATATAQSPGPRSPDVVSRKHIGAMLSNAVGRDRSSTHTDLDKGSRPPVKSTLSPQPPQHTNVAGTWTCDYCTNLVFDGDICDVCAHERGTLV